MKTIFRLPLLLMSIVTLFFASCGDMKNNGKNPGIVTDENTYVALGDFTSSPDRFTMKDRIVALDVDFDHTMTADLTLYNVSLNGQNINIVAQGLALEKTTDTTFTFTIGNVTPLVRMADKDVQFVDCPLKDVKGIVDTKNRTMDIEFTLDSKIPGMGGAILVKFNGKLVDKEKQDQVISEQENTISYEEEYAATGVLKVDDMYMPENVLRVGIDSIQGKAKLYLAKMSLDNGKKFVTLGVEEITATKTGKVYQLEAESAVAVKEEDGKTTYFTACKFENLTGRIDTEAGTMDIHVTFVYVGPDQQTHTYDVTFKGELKDDAQDPHTPVLCAYDFLASGDFSAREKGAEEAYSIGDRKVGVNLNKDNTADITFYAFTYEDNIDGIDINLDFVAIQTKGLTLQQTGNGYTFSINETTPIVKLNDKGEATDYPFDHARFKNMQGSIDNGKMDIHFDIEYTDPYNNRTFHLEASYSGTLQ